MAPLKVRNLQQTALVARMLLVTPGITTSNKKLLVTRASLLVANSPERPVLPCEMGGLRQCSAHAEQDGVFKWQLLVVAFLLLVAMPGAPSSVLVPSSKARSP